MYNTKHFMIDVQYIPCMLGYRNCIILALAIRFNIPDGYNIYCSRTENRKTASTRNETIQYRIFTIDNNQSNNSIKHTV